MNYISHFHICFRINTWVQIYIIQLQFLIWYFIWRTKGQMCPGILKTQFSATNFLTAIKYFSTDSPARFLVWPMIFWSNRALVPMVPHQLEPVTFPLHISTRKKCYTTCKRKKTHLHLNVLSLSYVIGSRQTNLQLRYMKGGVNSNYFQQTIFVRLRRYVPNHTCETTLHRVSDRNIFCSIIPHRSTPAPHDDMFRTTIASNSGSSTCVPSK